VTNCTLPGISFPSVKRRKVEADFCGGHITSDGGVILLRQADRLTGLSKSLVKVLNDARQAGKLRHDLLSLLRQRIYGLALGYEDLSDHNTLRNDLALQTMESRQAVSSTAITTITVSCPCMYFAVTGFWLPICAPATSMGPSIHGPSCLCWSKGYAGPGPRYRSFSGVTAASAATVC